MLKAALRRWVYAGLFGLALTVGAARAAAAQCWQGQGGVYCETCGTEACCLQFFQNGQCCDPTWTVCWET